MHTKIAAFALALSLTGCQTTKPLEPLAFGKQEGGALLQLCFGDYSQDRAFDLALGKIDPATGRLANEPPGHRIEKTLELRETQTVAFAIASYRRECMFWQFSATAGKYAFTKFGERLDGRGQQVSTSPLAEGLGSLLGAIIRKTAKNDTIVFVGSDGTVTDDTPTFEIKAGETTHLGTIVFIGEKKSRQHPVADKDGYWDGVTTETVRDLRLIVRYHPAGTGEIDTKAITGPYESRLPRQTISALVGRDLLLEDFPAIENPE
ncbi:hypothetical protein [Nisaea sediminum]|uniref:hypothetical protein n=1 Tax=Nisaea sediminum TaxID=2775867 RepID=UPI0018689F51|nr:hypothetical protein [Nisaea sediminum]